MSQSSVSLCARCATPIHPGDRQCRGCGVQLITEDTTSSLESYSLDHPTGPPPLHLGPAPNSHSAPSVTGIAGGTFLGVVGGCLAVIVVGILFLAALFSRPQRVSHPVDYAKVGATTTIEAMNDEWDHDRADNPIRAEEKWLHKPAIVVGDIKAIQEEKDRFLRFGDDLYVELKGLENPDKTVEAIFKGTWKAKIAELHAGQRILVKGKVDRSSDSTAVLYIDEASLTPL